MDIITDLSLGKAYGINSYQLNKVGINRMWREGREPMGHIRIYPRLRKNSVIFTNLSSATDIEFRDYKNLWQLGF